MATETPTVAQNIAPATLASQKLADYKAWLLTFAGKDGYNPYNTISSVVTPLEKALASGLNIDQTIKAINALTRDSEPTVEVFKPATPPMPRTPGSQEIIQQQPRQGVQQLG